MPASENSNHQKDKLHPRNKHRHRYDFPTLISSVSALEKYVAVNEHGDISIDFADPAAVKVLNKALLRHFYGIELWDIPDGYLCPPIPGRADYIHYAADLLQDQYNKIPTGKSIRILDIGVGANCIYPLLGYKEYGWSFVGTETDHLAIRSAKNIIEANNLSKAISIRKQVSNRDIFEGVIYRGEKFDLTMCNPPFHSSLQQSRTGTERKWKNLGKAGPGEALNFGGKNSELWCEGGEQRFVTQMIRESAAFADSVKWFTALVSKKETLAPCYRELGKLNAAEVRTIGMSQGQKTSRMLAWTFSEDTRS